MKRKTKNRICLVQAPIWGIYEPPFSLSLLSAWLKRSGLVVDVLDLNIELYNKRTEKYSNAWAIEQCMLWSDENYVSKFFEDNKDLVSTYVDEIMSNKVDIVGFSVNSASKEASLKLAALIKERNKDAIIIFGGHLFMIQDEEEINALFHTGLVDYIVYGEGDTAFSELVEIINNGDDVSKCLGIYYKNKEKAVIKTSQRPLLKNLDDIPFMDFTSMPLNNYENPKWLGKHLTIQASRGCPWRCAFCGATTYWKGFRMMSGKRIYDEIFFHIKNNPELEHIEFMDLLFNGNMRALEEFCDLMIANPPKKDLVWHVNGIIRPEMTPNILDKMKKAGCLRITYGIESGSQRVLGLMKKNYKIEVAHKVLKATSESGILVKANFMFGFPGETKEDFQMTLDFIKKSGKYINTAYPSFSFCVVESNSYLGHHMEEYGIKPNALDNLYWESEDGTNTYPERMRRWEEFSNFAREIGMDIGIGLNTSLEQHRWMNLGYYYKSKGDYKASLEAFSNYQTSDPSNTAISSEISRLHELISLDTN